MYLHSAAVYATDISSQLACVELLFVLTVQFKVAEQFSQLIRQYPTAIPTTYSGDYGADWTHLILTYVIQVCYAPCCGSTRWAGLWGI